jgi:hypothetical protein
VQPHVVSASSTSRAVAALARPSPRPQVADQETAEFGASGEAVDVVHRDLTDRTPQRARFFDDEHEVVISILVLLVPRAMLLGRDDAGREEPPPNVVVIPPRERHGQVALLEEPEPDAAGDEIDRFIDAGGGHLRPLGYSHGRLSYRCHDVHVLRLPSRRTAFGGTHYIYRFTPMEDVSAAIASAPLMRSTSSRSSRRCMGSEITRSLARAARGQG